MEGYYKASHILRQDRPTAHSKIVRVRKAKVNLRSLSRFVYRVGQSKYVHWSTFEAQTKALCPLPTRQLASVRSRLMRDHLASILVVGEVYSLPIVDRDVAQSAATPAHPGSVLAVTRALEDSAANSFMTFQLLDLSVASKKLLPSEKRAFRHMRWPIRIQRMTKWRGLDRYPADTYEMCFEVDPEIVDAVDLVPWSLWRYALRKWELAQCDVVGCYALRNSVCVAAIPVADVSSMSALVCVETLFSRGWQLGTPPSHHTLMSEQLFWVDDPVRSLPYLRCLLALEDVLPSAPGGIPSTAGVAVYQALLGGKSLAEATLAVRAKRPALKDTRARKRKGERPLQQGSRVKKQRQLSATSQLEALSDIICGFCALENAIPMPMQTPAGDSSTLAAIEDVSASASSSDLAIVSGALELRDVASSAVTQSAAPSKAESVEPMVTQSTVAQSTVAQSTVTQIVPSTTVTEASVTQSTVTQSEVTQERPLPLFVEGCRVLGEFHTGTSARPQMYSRIAVQCPCDNHRGRPGCKKRRNNGDAQCAAHGPLEPYAYLGAWLVARTHFANRAAHVAYSPSPGDVAAYMAKMGWPTQAIGHS